MRSWEITHLPCSVNNSKMFHELIKVAPDVWSMVCQQFADGRWNDFADICDNAALVDRCRTAVGKLSDAQRRVSVRQRSHLHSSEQTFTMQPRDLLPPYLPGADLYIIPESERPMALLVYVALNRNDQNKRIVEATLLFTSIYRRLDVERAWPYLPEDYDCGKLPKVVFTPIVLQRNIDDSDSQWMIHDLNFIVMP